MLTGLSTHIIDLNVEIEIFIFGFVFKVVGDVTDVQVEQVAVLEYPDRLENDKINVVQSIGALSDEEILADPNDQTSGSINLVSKGIYTFFCKHLLIWTLVLSWDKNVKCNILNVANVISLQFWWRFMLL